MTTVENSHTAGILSRVVIIYKAIVLNKNEISRDMLPRIYLSHWQGGQPLWRARFMRKSRSQGTQDTTAHSDERKGNHFKARAASSTVFSLTGTTQCS